MSKYLMKKKAIAQRKVKKERNEKELAHKFQSLMLKMEVFTLMRLV